MSREKNEPQEQFWTCKGRGENWHIEAERYHLEERLTSDKCPKCGRKRPSQLIDNGRLIPSSLIDDLQPPKDRRLLAGLTVLNLVSGSATMQGAAEFLKPQIAGYLAGATIQILLFLLLSSSSTLKHRPKLKWLVIGLLSFVSVYTSFFAYYELLTQGQQITDSRNRAISAHQNTISKIFTPINNKSEELINEVKRLNLLIEQEEAGDRISGKSGCDVECNKLKSQREVIQNQRDQVSPVVNNLKSLFQYDLENKETQDIFQSDLEAIAQVTRNCLPSKPKFVCLPDEYVGVLDPQSSKYRQFRSTYVDEDLAIDLLTPVIKIGKGEMPAIGAAIFALIVDGCIIALGLGIEARPKSRKLALRIIGSGSEFLDKLLESIDSPSLTIDFESLQNTDNGREYLNLLQNIRAETDWLLKVEEEQKWQIVSHGAEAKLNSWLVKQRQDQISLEIDSPKEASNIPQHQNVIFLQLPTRYDH
jgi:hypothetical protein